MIAGIVIACLLGAHVFVLHLNDVLGTGDDPVSWAAMIARSGQGGWVVLYISMLAFILYHALYGLRGIILEMTGARIGRTLTVMFLVIGVAIFIWGAYVPIALLFGEAP
jgi:succinate dehydrogenase hydrophobic anchor subunit